jgi:hypothetical protein
VRFLVIGDYPPGCGGEIALLFGNFVLVDWCQGDRDSRSNERTSTRGYFPFENFEQNIEIPMIIQFFFGIPIMF